MNLQSSFNQFIGTFNTLSSTLKNDELKAPNASAQQGALAQASSFNKEYNSLLKEQQALSQLDKRLRTSRQQVESFKKRQEIVNAKRDIIGSRLESVGYNRNDYLLGGKR